MILSILSPITSLILIIVVGYVITKLNIFTNEMQKSLSNFVMKVTLPCMLVNSLQVEFNSTILINSIFAIFFGFFVHFIVLFISYNLLNRSARIKKDEVGLLSFGITFCNIAYIGFPVVSSILGQEALIYGTMLTISFNLITLTVGLKLCCQGRNIKLTPRDLISNPVIAIIIGLGLFILNFKIPEVILYPIQSIGNITTPLFLIITGSIVASNKIDKSFFSPSILMVSFFRLLVIPFIIYGILLLLPIDNFLRMCISINLAMPTGAIIVVLSRDYDLDSYLASKILVTTTLLSSITIPIITLVVRGV